jgi:hypothetical protein
MEQQQLHQHCASLHPSWVLTEQQVHQVMPTHRSQGGVVTCDAQVCNKAT